MIVDVIDFEVSNEIMQIGYYQSITVLKFVNRMTFDISLTEIYHGLRMEKSWNSMEKTWTPCKNHGFSMRILNMGRIHGAYCLDYMGCPWIFHGFSMGNPWYISVRDCIKW